MTDGVEDVELTERDVVGLLKAYDDARTAATKAKAKQDAIGAQLKAWLEKHDEPLYDGEHGLEAKLTTVPGAKVYDLVNLRVNDPVLYQRLGHLGALTVDAKVAAAQADQLPGLSRYAMPGAGHTRLDVKGESMKRHLPAIGTRELQSTEETRSVRCPFCGVGPGERCRTSGLAGLEPRSPNSPYPLVHKARVRLLQKQRSETRT